MANKPYQDESTLRELYVDERLSTTDIAERLDCSPKTVNRWLKRHDIPIRDKSEAVTNGYLSDDAKAVLCDKDTLAEWYYGREMSLPDIGDEIGVSFRTVANWMDKHGLERRSISEARKWQWLSADAKAVLSDPDTLERLYHEERVPTQEMAAMVGCSPQTLRNYLHEHGIELRPQGAQRGELNAAYKHGESISHGPNWTEEREVRIEYDNHQCVVCGQSRESHYDEHGFDLHVHHVTPWWRFKDDDGDINHDEANKLTNLVTMCISDHNRWEGIPLRPDGE